MDIKEYMPDAVRGFLDAAEGEALHRLARTASRLGPCLEIGSYCGKSAVYLGAACRDTGSVLFSIDHHGGAEDQQPGERYFDPALFDYQAYRVDTLAEFRATLARTGLEDTVVPMVCASGVAAKSWATPLGLVFIDGGHSEEAARQDYDAWHHHILPGGYLLIHDIFPDPARGGQAPYHIYRHAIASGKFDKHPMVGTLGILEKKPTVERDRPGIA